MKKLNFALAFFLVFFSLTLAKEQPKAQPQTKEMLSSGMSMETGKGDQETVDLMETMNLCNESFRIDIAYLMALNDSGSFPDETDRTPKCFVKCVLEKTKVASEDGKYDPQVTSIVFAGERGGKVMNDIEDLAKTCSMKRDEPCKCERAYQFIKCLMEKEIEEYEKA